MTKEKTLKKERGITLIALVVTIVVLLILAGISLNLVLGNNGIIAKAKEARDETRSASVEEIKKLWKEEKNIDNYVEEKTAQSLEELLDNLKGQDLITEEEKTTIETKGYIVIGSKNISFVDGLKKSSYTITSDSDEVYFNKIIKEGDILVEKTGFTTYKIEGISNSKDGEYITSGSVNGKSGNLEIVGDIADSTFKYNLTSFMKGDEIFYCKVNIDGEEFYKEIEVIQGDVVRYEEDFVGLTYTGTWNVLEDENCSGGKAIYTDTLNDTVDIQNFVGSKVDLKSIADEKSGVMMIYVYAIDSDESSRLTHLYRIVIDGTTEKEYSLICEKNGTNIVTEDGTSESRIRIKNVKSKVGDVHRIYLDAIYIER